MFLKPFGFIGQGDALAVNPAVTSDSYAAGGSGTAPSLTIQGTHASSDPIDAYFALGNSMTVDEGQLEAASGGTGVDAFFEVLGLSKTGDNFDVSATITIDDLTIITNAAGVEGADQIKYVIKERNNGGTTGVLTAGDTITGLDATPATFSSANVNAAGDTLQVVFSEAVYGTSIPAAFTLSGVSAGTPTLGTITGFGTDTLSSPISTNLPANGDTLTLAYASATGDLTDAKGNEVASFTGQSVTNNVPSASVFTDDFNRADESLEDNVKWTLAYDEVPANTNGLDVVSNQLSASGNTDTKTYRYEETLANNQYAQIEYVSHAFDGDFGIFVRWAPGVGAGDGYRAYCNVDGNIIALRSIVDGAGSNIATHSHTMSAGDKIRIEANGTTIRVLLDTGSGFSEIMTTTNSDHTSGHAAIQANTSLSGSSVVLDNWECGNL